MSLWTWWVLSLALWTVLPTSSVVDYADAFIAGWVIRFSMPAFLTSYRVIQFTSSFSVAVMSCLGISHKMTSAFHLQSNGAIERFNCRLKDALRAVPREESGVLAAEMVYGVWMMLPRPVVTNGEPLLEDIVVKLRDGMPA
jgi:hypothetical protein